MAEVPSNSFVRWSILGYVLVVIGIIGGLYAAQRWASRELGTENAQAEWDQWRDTVRQLPEDNTVKRKVPKSDEPPALKLMRDYFGVSLAMCLILGSVLYGTLLIAIKGVFASTNSSEDLNA